MSRNTIKKTIEELIFIQRSDNGQLYMIQSLQNSFDFSVQSHGTQTLKDFCAKDGVNVWKGSNTKKYSSNIEHVTHSFQKDYMLIQ